MSHSQNVVVTGIGVVSPLGLNAPSAWAELVQGHSGIDFITSFDTEGFETRFAAEVKGFEPEDYLDRKEARRMDRFAQFAVALVGLGGCPASGVFVVGDGGGQADADAGLGAPAVAG